MLLTILNSSDLHSTHHIYNNSYLRPPSSSSPSPSSSSLCYGGIGRRMKILKQLREQYQNILLFDCGDYFAGSLYFEEYKGEVDIEVINHMKYNAISIGNHDSDKGLDNLKEQLNKLSNNIPVLCSNLILKENNQLLFQNYHIIYLEENYKIGVFGILGKNAYECTQPDFQKEVILLSPLDIFRQVGNELKQQQQCDLIICLSHSGYDEDLILVNEPVVDILFGGHTHKSYKDNAIIVKNGLNNTIGGTIWHQSPSHGAAFTFTQILIEKIENSNNIRLELVDSCLKWVDSNLDEDEEILQWFNVNYGDYLAQKIQQRIAHCQVDWLIRDTDKMKQGNTLLGSLIAHFVADAMCTNIGLVNRGGIKTGFTNNEIITYGKAVEVLGNNNRLMSIEIKGILLESLLNHTIPSGEYQYYGLEVIFINDDDNNEISKDLNLNLEIDIDLVEESKLKKIKYKINNEIIQSDNWYHIGLVDYMWDIATHRKDIYFSTFDESIHGDFSELYRNIILSNYWQDQFATYLERLQILSPSTLSHLNI